MEKRFILILTGIFILSVILSSFASAELSISKTIISDVVAKELSQPATFTLKVSNDAGVDYFELYTYVDAILAPRGAMRIEKGEAKDIELEVYAGTKLREEKKGGYTFVYYLKGQKNTVEDRLVVRILPLKEMISIAIPDSITTSDSEVILTIANNESMSFNNLRIDANSAFMKSSHQFNLGPYEKTEITLPLDKSKLSSVLAGSYITTISLSVNNEATLQFDKSILVQEEYHISTDEVESGTLFYPIFTVTKRNNGNIISDVEIVIKKNAFANTFTSFSKQPDRVEVKGLTYIYTWYATLKPQESLGIEAKTNYLLPIGILFAVLVIATLIWIYMMGEMVVRKKVVRVRSKGGEFAMKVMIFVKARHSVSDIKIRERLPHLAELYERFGSLQPNRFDKAKGILEWDIPRMERGEETIISYIFYSKVSIVGRFELPRTLVTFKESKGKTKQIFSNAVYFFEERNV